jgi:hypothetical protein
MNEGLFTRVDQEGVPCFRANHNRRARLFQDAHRSILDRYERLGIISTVTCPSGFGGIATDEHVQPEPYSN